MEKRVCSKCKQEKSLKDFYKDKTKKSGYKSQCKACLKTPEKSEYQRIYAREHKDYHRQKHAEYRSRNREYLRDLSKKRREDNPDMTRIYYQKNRDRILERNHEYNTSEHGRKVRAQYSRSEKGKGYKTAYRMRRRSSGSLGDRDITLEKLYNRDGGICALCGKPCDYEDYVFQGATFVAGNDYPSIDHVKPLSKGGSHTWDNVQLVHKICNSIKSNKS